MTKPSKAKAVRICLCGDSESIHTGVMSKDEVTACCAVDEQGQVCACPRFREDIRERGEG